MDAFSDIYATVSHHRGVRVMRVCWWWEVTCDDGFCCRWWPQARIWPDKLSNFLIILRKKTAQCTFFRAKSEYILLLLIFSLWSRLHRQWPVRMLNYLGHRFQFWVHCICIIHIYLCVLCILSITHVICWLTQPINSCSECASGWIDCRSAHWSTARNETDDWQVIRQRLETIYDCSVADRFHCDSC